MAGKRSDGMPRRRLALLCASVVTIASLAFAGQAAAFAPRAPSEFFGVSAPDLWALSVQDRTSELDTQLAQIKTSGFDWVRTEVAWRDVEPRAPANGAHTYNWSIADRHVASLASHGLSTRPMLLAAPSWAADPAADTSNCGGNRAVGPSHAGDFAAFAGAVVRRYGPGGEFWASHPDLPEQPIRYVELWNEPNFRSFWCPAPDPEAFSSMILQATDAIHGVDPTVHVVLGGLAAFRQTQSTGMAPDEFLRRMLQASPTLASGIDAVGFHPYALTPARDLALIGWLRQSMNAIGFGQAQIALTEFGWHGGTSPGSLPEDQRAANYQQFTDQVARTDCGISAVAAHDWVSPELNQDDPDDWYGITDPSTGALKPSGQAYVDEATLLEGKGQTPPPSVTIPACSPPPSVTITSQPGATVRTGSAQLAFASSAPGTFRCNLDQSGWAACSSPTSYTGLEDGSHTFQVEAVDLAGKIGPSASYRWTVDTTPPRATITSHPNATVRTGSVRLYFARNEPGTFRCRLDGSGWRPCTAPTSYTRLADGRHIFQVAAVDRAGNVGQPASYAWTVDTTAPRVTISSRPTPTTGASTARFAVTSSEPSTLRCRLDASGWRPCTATTTYTGLADGRHTFQVAAVDRAGNAGQPASFAWTVDTAPSAATITSQPAATQPPAGTATKPSAGSGRCRMSHRARHRSRTGHPTKARGCRSHHRRARRSRHR